MRLLVLLTMLAGCAPHASLRHPPAFHQTPAVDSASNACLRNPACYMQTGNTAPMAWALRSAEAVRTTAAVLRLLDAAQLARVEQILTECAQDAHHRISDREFGPGKRPTREQCSQVVRREDGKAITLAMELGRMKHELALECASRKLGPLFPENVSVGPRYKFDPATGRWQLLDPEQVAAWLREGLFELLLGTLVPDVVVHDSGNPLRGQRVYDFKFPCMPTNAPSWRQYPEGHPHHPKDQKQMYREALGGDDPPSFVTPQLGISQ